METCGRWKKRVGLGKSRWPLRHHEVMPGVECFTSYLCPMFRLWCRCGKLIVLSCSSGPEAWVVSNDVELSFLEKGLWVVVSAREFVRGTG